MFFCVTVGHREERRAQHLQHVRSAPSTFEAGNNRIKVSASSCVATALNPTINQQLAKRRRSANSPNPCPTIPLETAVYQ